jgi:hypothetical protein
VRYLPASLLLPRAKYRLQLSERDVEAADELTVSGRSVLKMPLSYLEKEVDLFANIQDIAQVG